MSMLGKRLSRPVGRDAARRRQETELLSDLASELPLRSSEVEHVTQMKALKLAIQFSRLHQVLKLGGPGKRQITTFNDNLWLNGIFWHETKILLLVDSDGIVMYASQQMTALLGLMQVDVIGEPFSSVIHPDDKKDFMLLLKDKTTCSHLIRMKDTLSFNTRDSGNHLWRVMHLFALGHTSKEGMSFTVFECEPFDKVPILELVIGSSTEVFMHVPTRTAVSVDWKFELITGINKDDIVGTNPVLLYGFPSEVEAFEESRQKALHAVLSTGEWWHVPSRILSGYGEWYWARLHLKANKIRNGELLEMKCRTIILGPYKPEEAYNLTRNHQQPLPSVSTHHVAVSLPTPPSSHSSTDKTISQGPSEVSTPSPQSLCLSSIDSGSVDVLGTRVSVEGTASSLPGMSNIVLTGSPKAEPSLNQALVNCEADLLSTQVHELLQVPPAPVQHDMTEECTHCHELLDFILEEQLCQ